EDLVQDRLPVDPLRDQIAGAEVWFVQQVPRRHGDEPARGGHASSPVRRGLGEDLEIIETLLQQLADYVSRWAPTARSDRRLHVEVVEPQQRTPRPHQAQQAGEPAVAGQRITFEESAKAGPHA